MGNFEALARRFAAANLRAEVIERPLGGRLGARAPDIFQMTIAGRRREEFFRIWPGARANRVEAEGIDRELDQLVLLVWEPERVFLEAVSKQRARIDRTKVKIVREDALHVWIERRTNARKRHFLCGRDERQLFICQLPQPVTTVRRAHEVLRAPAAAQSKCEVVRQGEWFFVEPTADELAALAVALRTLRTVVRRRVPIGWGGHPHLADDLVVVPTTPVGKVVVERAVLVRGRVRHMDHDKVVLPSWAKVVRNMEPVANDGVARMDGVRWVD